MTDTIDFSFCNAYMLPGEYVLWKGRPEKGNVLTKRELTMLPFALLWTGFAVFWEYFAIRSSGSLFFCLWGMPFVCIGLYMLFGQFIYKAYLRDKTFYVVTNQKLMIKWGKKLQVYTAGDLPPMNIVFHKNGNGTILFENVWYAGNRRRSGVFSLDNLPDVVQAQNALTTMKNGNA